MGNPFRNPKTATEYGMNYDVLAENRGYLHAYLEKSAAEHGTTAVQVAGLLAEKRDPEYLELLKRVREAEAVTPADHPAVVAKRMRHGARLQHDALQAEVAKRAASGAVKYSGMTPSEVELHKRAAALADEKRISHGNAMGLLMETSKEARDLYRKIDRERFNRTR